MYEHSCTLPMNPTIGQHFCQQVCWHVNISINVTKPYNDKIRPEENPCIVGTYTFEKVTQNVAAKSMPSVSTFCQQIC